MKYGSLCFLGLGCWVARKGFSEGVSNLHRGLGAFWECRSTVLTQFQCLLVELTISLTSLEFSMPGLDGEGFGVPGVGKRFIVCDTRFLFEGLGAALHRSAYRFPGYLNSKSWRNWLHRPCDFPCLGYQSRVSFSVLKLPGPRSTPRYPFLYLVVDFPRRGLYWVSRLGDDVKQCLVVLSVRAVV